MDRILNKQKSFVFFRVGGHGGHRCCHSGLSGGGGVLVLGAKRVVGGVGVLVSLSPSLSLSSLAITFHDQLGQDRRLVVAIRHINQLLLGSPGTRCPLP